jgi:hypothetical protein
MFPFWADVFIAPILDVIRATHVAEIGTRVARRTALILEHPGPTRSGFSWTSNLSSIRLSMRSQDGQASYGRYWSATETEAVRGAVLLAGELAFCSP